MPAHEYVNPIQFGYDNPDFGTAKPMHRITAMTGGSSLGTMIWNSSSIRNINVNPGQERRGVATAMWHEGHRMAEENARIPKPKHSTQRTREGDAWARSVGGRLPRRKK